MSKSESRRIYLPAHLFAETLANIISIPTKQKYAIMIKIAIVKAGFLR